MGIPGATRAPLHSQQNASTSHSVLSTLPSSLPPSSFLPSLSPYRPRPLPVPHPAPSPPRSRGPTTMTRSRCAGARARVSPTHGRGAGQSVNFLICWIFLHLAGLFRSSGCSSSSSLLLPQPLASLFRSSGWKPTPGRVRALIRGSFSRNTTRCPILRHWPPKQELTCAAPFQYQRC